MLASTFMDLVIGADIHFEMVPMPVPTPTPIPHPFMGMVGDLKALAVNLLISNVVDMAMAGAISAPKGPVVINLMPATNTGTDVKNKTVLPHFVIPPGTMWTPMPKAPKPKIGLHATPDPDPPVAPAGDAVLMMGSKTVTLMGSNAVRFGDLAMSCSEPLRMPSSTVMALPKGMPVMIGGPPAIDWQQAAGALLRSKWVANELHGLLSRLKNERLRNLLGKLVCFVTGHPVDVATGRLLTWATDWELPGPIPLSFERNYASSWSARDGVLGRGWSHTFDEAVWIERGRVVYRAGDGREIEFDTFALPQHLMRKGDEVYDPINRLTLRCKGPFSWQIEGADGLTRSFEQQPAKSNGVVSQLVSISSPAGHEVRLEYDRKARLEWLHDSAGRLVRFEYDRTGRLWRIALPHPSQDGWLVHTVYQYSDEGDLAVVVDPLGHRTRYEYAGHLMVRETDRTGLSFYFGYDGTGHNARCVRTWGDGGIYDHEIFYDVANHTTIVTNSLGETKTYFADALNLVRKVVDPLGNETKYDYDGALRRVKVTLADGSERTTVHDARGNRVEMIASDGAKMEFVYAGDGLPVSAVMPTGATWSWRYDDKGRLVEQQDPLGAVERYRYDPATRMLAAIVDAAGAQTTFGYDGTLEINRVGAADRSERRFVHDRLGRVIEEIDERGSVRRTQYDALGRPVRVDCRGEATRAVEYDGEGHPRRVTIGRRVIELTYTGRHVVGTRTEAGATVRFRYDTEDRIVATTNENGETWSVRRDGAGRVVAEVDFDGAETKLALDKCGRVIGVTKPSGAHTKIKNDPMGRPTLVTFADGTKSAYTYRADGLLVEAKNQHAVVKLERDDLGRVVRDQQNEDWTASTYDRAGRRIGLTTSLGLEQKIEVDERGRARRVGVRNEGASWWWADLERDASGLETRRRFPGGEALTERDQTGRPLVQTIVSGGAERDVRAFQWDDQGRLAMTVDPLHGAATLVRDPRARLVKVERAGAPSEVLSRDAVGNVYGSADQKDREYGAGGRLKRAGATHFLHDADGQLIGSAVKGEMSWRYQFGASGLLDAVVRPDGERVEFQYDALGRRIGKAGAGVTRRFVWDGNNTVHELSSVSGVVSWAFEPGTMYPLARVQAGDSTGIVRDYQGTPRALIQDDGEVSTVSITATGTAGEGVSTATLPWRYEGQYADEETGLSYNRFRYYDPQLGRYISKDPLGVIGGLNVYAYVADPTAATDPFGLLDAFDTAPLASGSHVGDGLDAHELLQSAWLKANVPGYQGRRTGFGRQNPAMALDPAVHDAITAAQRKAGLLDPAKLATQTAKQNIRANAKILEAELLAQGFSKAEAKAITKAFENEAKEYAEEHARCA